MSSDNQNLKTMADILFMPVLFYVLTKWGDIDSIQGRFLWVALLMIVYNEMMSVRESYVVYQVSIYTLDLFSLFIFVVALDALSDNSSPIGYNPTFWLAISGLWLNYAVWDILMSKLVDKKNASDFLVWASCMICFSFLNLFCYFVILFTFDKISIPLYKNINIVAQLISISLIIWSLSMWILDRHKWFSGLRED